MELEAHPARTMPYTLREMTAKTKSRPISRLAITPLIWNASTVEASKWKCGAIQPATGRRSNPGLKGITATVTRAGTMARIGARLK